MGKSQQPVNHEEVKMKSTFPNYVQHLLLLQQMNLSLMAGMLILLFTLIKLQFYGMDHGTINKLVNRNH